jgi:hypothetical protein
MIISLRFYFLYIYKNGFLSLKKNAFWPKIIYKAKTYEKSPDYQDLLHCEL